jgi:HD-GYP domain-containing protein (c-di-GMP phosphodiesterase class II)
MCGMLTELIDDFNVDVRRVSSTILKHVIAQLGPNAASILVYDNDDSQVLKYAAGQGFRTAGFVNSAINRSLVSQIVREGNRVHYADLMQAKTEWTQSQALLQEGFHGYVGIPLETSNQMVGVLELFHYGVFHLNTAWLVLAEEMCRHSAKSLGVAWRMKQLQNASVQSANMVDATIEGWARMLEMRDTEPQGHHERVADMTVGFARSLGVADSDLVNIRRGAMLHDVGKMGISDQVLLKPDTLTDDEWRIMHQHPIIAFEKLSPIDALVPALDIPYCHHENWDGSGYPRGLAGEKIPFAARLFSIVDTWDILRTDRPWRKAWPDERVITHIRERGGKSFDPQLADLFTKLLEQWLRHKRMDGQPSVSSGLYESIVFHV